MLLKSILIRLLPLLLLWGCLPSHAEICCGKVPVYCIVQHTQVKDYQVTFSYRVNELYYTTMKTEYQKGWASPICRVTDFDYQRHWRECQRQVIQPGDRAVGITYYRGGDPADPAGHCNRAMYGHWWIYGEQKIFEEGLDLHGKYRFRPHKGADIIYN